MQWLNSYRKRLVVFGCVAAAMLGGESVKADFTFGTPTLVDEPINSAGIEYFDCISDDGLEIYIERPIPFDETLSLDWDIYVSTRETIDAPWSIPVSLGPTVNSTGYVDGSASLSSDGLELYFSSNCGGDGWQEILVTRRNNQLTAWGVPVSLGPAINTGGSNMAPWITPDGLELYFSSSRAGGSGNIDLWVSRRVSTRDPWETPENLGLAINSTVDDCFPSLSSDGLVLFFCDGDNPSLLYRPGGYGQTDMWMTRRRSTADPWELPVNLGPNVNTSHFESHPRISPDGSVLYFTYSRPGTMGTITEIRQAPIIPIVDFNTDGVVDDADMDIMIDLWGTDDPLCDIGPMPWGDGVVDVQDLIVLAEHLFEESTPAQ